MLCDEVIIVGTDSARLAWSVFLVSLYTSILKDYELTHRTTTDKE